MKKIFLISVITLFFCCSPKKTLLGETASITSECPTNGNCSVEMLQHKGLLVKEDEQGIHYLIEDNLEKTVFIYKYSKIVKGNLQDAGYREEVIFEIDNSFQNKILSDSEIQNTKMIFGRFCYCKGQTGYYKVRAGKLEMNSDTKTISVNFIINEVPQVIKQVMIALK